MINLLIFVNKFIDSFAYNQNISAKRIKTGFLFPVPITEDKQPMRICGFVCSTHKNDYSLLTTLEKRCI